MPSWDFCSTSYGPLDILMCITAVGVRASLLVGGQCLLHVPLCTLHSRDGWMPGIQLCDPDKFHPALAECLLFPGIGWISWISKVALSSSSLSESQVNAELEGDVFH